MATSYFDLNITVKAEHIDVLGHVNNVVYVAWMQDVATAHIEALGVGIEQYLELKHAMISMPYILSVSTHFFEQVTKVYCLQAIPSGLVLKLKQVDQNGCHRPLSKLINR